MTELEKSELEIVKQIEDLVDKAKDSIKLEDIASLKLACANIEQFYNRLSSIKSKKKVYPKIKKLKITLRIGF